MAFYKSENIGGGTKYSNTETEIGTWIDGRKRYRKIYTTSYTSIKSSETQIEFEVDFKSLNPDFETVFMSYSNICTNRQEIISLQCLDTYYGGTSANMKIQGTLKNFSSATTYSFKLIVIFEYCKK